MDKVKTWKRIGGTKTLFAGAMRFSRSGLARHIDITAIIKEAEAVEFALSELKPYGVCTVVGAPEDGVGARLRGIGVTEGAVIVRLFSAPSGDPTAYLVRGAVVALRRSDAERISVRGYGEWA